MITIQDNDFMKQAIELAYLGKWSAAPNPCVGAVLVYQGKVIAGGYHKAYGEAHAEVNCLLNAIELGLSKNNEAIFTNPLLEMSYQKHFNLREKTRINFADCVLYVTLEPCNHEEKTPPCTKAILESGIKKIVIGYKDPNPKAKGGIEVLKSHGVVVETDVLRPECEKLLEDFLVWQNKKLPFTILKMATTLDGKIGPALGGNHRISGAKSHEILMELRKNIGLANGAILVGANTFIKDNPKLTARTKKVGKNPRAVILGSDLLFEKSQHEEFYCFENRREETILYCSFKQSALPIAHRLKQNGINLVEIPQDNEKKKLDLKVLLADLYQNQNCPYVLCEGGAILGLSLLEQNLVDKLILYMAPKILGDNAMQSVFSGRNITDITKALNFQIEETSMAEQDLHIHLKPML